MYFCGGWNGSHPLKSSSKSSDKYPYTRKAEGDLRERERREPQEKEEAEWRQRQGSEFGVIVKEF